MSYIKSTLSANACIYRGVTALLLIGMDRVYLLFQKTCGAMTYDGGIARPGLGRWLLCNEISRRDDRRGTCV